MTQIQLIGDLEGYLDDGQDTVFPLNFAIAEIRDLSQRKGNYSKTINLQGTKNNNVLLNHYFDANIVAGTFDVAKRQDCIVIQNGVVILDNCYLQLLRVTNLKGLVTYEVVIKDKTSDFFQIINQLEMTDIDLTDANHQITASNVVASFSHTYSDVYKYGISRATVNNYQLSNIIPHLYVRPLFDRIVQRAGYQYQFALCRAIAPLRKKWATQASIEIADDPELISWMARAGCVGVFVGLESFSDGALCSQNKRIRSPEHYRHVATLHRHGIVVEAGLIFGFDSDGREVFESTLRIIDEIGIDAMQASILTPLPGTRLFEQMRSRIVDLDWAHYAYKWAVFEPAQMTRADLMAGLEWINKRFYSPGRIVRRLLRWMAMPRGLRNFYIPLWLNVAYWGRQFRFGRTVRW